MRGYLWAACACVCMGAIFVTLLGSGVRGGAGPSTQAGQPDVRVEPRLEDDTFICEPRGPC
jgi:hypothetical protein